MSLAAAILMAEMGHLRAVLYFEEAKIDDGQNATGYTKTECQMGFRSGLAGLHLGSNAVTDSDGRTTFGRTEDG